MSVEHRNLTGASLHEPKGAAGASSGEVYVANGSGSGTWQDPLADLNNKNLLVVSVPWADLSTAGSIYCPVPLACDVTKITIVADATFTGNNTITAQIVPSGSTTGTAISDISMALDGTNANTVTSDTASTGNTLAVTDTLRIITDGGGTGACPATVLITLDVSS